MKNLKFKIKSLFLTLAALSLPALALAGNATYIYDSYDRLGSVNYENGPAVIFSYDENGNLSNRTVEGSNVLNLVIENDTGNYENSVTMMNPPVSECGTEHYCFGNATSVTLTAVPHVGYNFASWSDPLCGTELTCIVSLDELTSMTANFAIKSFDVDAEVIGFGNISSSAIQTVNYDSKLTYKVTPDIGHEIADVTGCDGNLDGDVFTTGPIGDNCTVTANFSAMHKLNILTNISSVATITSTPAGVDCSPGCTAYFTTFTTVSLTLEADADPGYSFIGWDGEGCSGKGSCNIVMDSDKTLAAYFTTNGFKSIAAGSAHTLAVKSDGTLWSWGNAQSGRLGIGYVSGSYRSSPQAVGGDQDWKDVAAGNAHSMALKGENGSVYTWGDNYFGQLGNGTQDDSDTPVRLGGARSVIAAGMYHSNAIGTDSYRYYYAWGYNGYGQLGDGSNNTSYTPELVSLYQYKYVDAGSYHTITITDNGWLSAWGRNDDGQLGVGTTASGNPHQAAMQDAIAAAAGGNHTIAIKGDGTLWGWGDNTYGQVGDDTDVDRLSPLMIDSGTEWVAVAAGTNHNLALKSDGTVWAWGLNSSGQLGDNSNDDRWAPVQVAFLDNQIKTIEAGGNQSFAIKEDGSLWAWGANNVGQHGAGDLISYNKPRITATDIDDVKFIVNVSPVQNGTISPSSSQIVDSGAFLNYSIISAENYVISDVSGCGGNLVGNVYTTGAFDSNCTVTATFATIFTLTTNAGTGGSITPANPDVAYGNATTFTIIPDTGKDLLSVNSDCGGSLVGNTYTTGAVTSECQITAEFGYTLTVLKNISSGGTVTGTPAGIDCGSACSAVFAINSTVSLQAVRSEGYFFTGWTDGECEGTGDCGLTLDAEKTVTANFQTCATQTPVRIAGSPPTSYSTIQAAYDAAVDGDVIQSRELSITENVTLDQNISIRLEGGYDCSFEMVTGKTTVVGDMRVSDGTVTIENVKTSP